MYWIACLGGLTIGITLWYAFSMKKNLKGQRFGKWQVVAERNKRNGKTMWYCLCDCGAECLVRATHLLSGHSQSCGCTSVAWNKAHTMALAPNWRGGRCVDDCGYPMIYCPQHPYGKSNGYIREHRLVMESKLGRYLIKSETVHHINGIKNDNRPENLELWLRSHPPGQRVEDVVEWAKKILEIYG